MSNYFGYLKKSLGVQRWGRARNKRGVSDVHTRFCFLLGLLHS